MNELLAFGNVYSSAPWGGGWIKALFARTDAPEVCSESWEVSGHPFGMSVVRDGPFAGRTLASLTEEFGEALVGTKAPDPKRFPLLVKLLDARRSLSVQVHPNERNAALTHGEPKTESWIVLAAAPGATLYAGVADGVTEAELREAVMHGEALVGTLRRHAVKAGDVLDIPGGVIHAIGAGCLIFEVQQSSNTTYRLYDWDRVDAYGHARALHEEQALKSIDFDFPPVNPHRATDEANARGNVWRSFVRTPAFVVRELVLNGDEPLEMDGSSFVALFVLDGSVKVRDAAASRHVMRGGSLLIPATAQDVVLSADIAGTRVLVTTL